MIMTREEQKGTLVEIDLTEEKLNDKVEIILNDDYEIQIEDGKAYIIKKRPQYPKTYEECCNILKATHVEWFGYYGEVLVPFQKLIICRNVYRKIAGEQMGLDGPWEPSKYENVYCIFRLKGEIVKDNFVFADSLILEFPTEEMRDAFYENFKDLINETKELL